MPIQRRAVLGSPFSCFVHPSRVRLAIVVLSHFSQLSARIPRTSPFFLDFRHPNDKNASFSENIRRKILPVGEKVVPLHSLSEKRWLTPLERSKRKEFFDKIYINRK